ncbi:MAG: ester cyclase [Chloroflexi bacterium]|nr:ester cyclase [Chloroflexota bacterium]
MRLYREEYFCQGRLELVAELFGETVIVHGSPMTRDEMDDLLRVWQTAFPDLACAIELMVAEGNYVVEYTRTTGTHQADLFGIPATGKRMEAYAVYIHRFEAGRIAELAGIIDQLTLFQQLGVISLPE